MKKWSVEAVPIFRGLIDAEDRVVSEFRSPLVTLWACGDQLGAAVRHAEDWLYEHPCPDRPTGDACERLILACGGIWAITSTTVHTEEGHYGEWCENYLTSHVTSAARARSEIEAIE
jgi:hypothetical protein